MAHFGELGLTSAVDRHRRRRRERGLTLIEVLMVAFLIGLMSAVVFLGSGLLGSSRLRSAAAIISAGVRVGVSRANTTGKPVRLVFDLDNQIVRVEETSGKMLREKDENESSGAGADPATEAEKEVRERAATIMDGPRAPRARFTPVVAFQDEEPEGKSLGRGVRFRQIQTEHDGRPRTEGRAYLYIWPGGQTERAAIQLYRDGDDDGLTVVVNALTGRAKIQRGRVELEASRTEADFGEREE